MCDGPTRSIESPETRPARYALPRSPDIALSVCPHAKMRVALLTAVTGQTDSRLADRYSTRGSRLWCTWTLYEAARHRLSPSTRRACRVPAKNAARRGYSRRSRERASARIRLRDRRGQRATAAHIDVLLGDSRGRRRSIPRRGGSRSEETSTRAFEPSGSRGGDGRTEKLGAMLNFGTQSSIWRGRHVRMA